MIVVALSKLTHLPPTKDNFLHFQFHKLPSQMRAKVFTKRDGGERWKEIRQRSGK